jgi:hypothetical protein
MCKNAMLKSLVRGIVVAFRCNATKGLSCSKVSELRSMVNSHRSRTTARLRRNMPRASLPVARLKCAFTDLHFNSYSHSVFSRVLSSATGRPKQLPFDGTKRIQSKVQKAKTYNRGYSLVVTDPTTNPPIWSLMTCRAAEPQSGRDAQFSPVYPWSCCTESRLI